jgi:hypothetical protein
MTSLSRRLFLLCVCLLLPLCFAHAQDTTPTPSGLDNGVVDSDTNVYVTTQDRSSLRIGPGLDFERLAIVPPAQTLRAVGRSAQTDWIQVDYDGQMGWISTDLLVWTGKIADLPVDGVNPVPFVRVQVVTWQVVGPLYDDPFTPEVVLIIPQDAPIIVEVTARLGQNYQTLSWIQIKLDDGRLFWVRGILGRTRYPVIDMAYLIPYMRLLGQFSRSNAARSLDQIEQIWNQIAIGEPTSCSFIPRYAVRNVSDTDLLQEPAFLSAAQSFDNAIVSINAAIARFEDVCRRGGNLSAADIVAAQADVRNARRNLTIGLAIVVTLGDRNPLITR